MIAQARGLSARGFDVQVLAGGDPGSGGDGWSRAEAAGLRTVRLRFLRRSVHPVRDLLALLEVVRFLRADRPTIVHTLSSKAGVIGRLAARLSRVPVIVHTVHGWSFRDYHGSSVRALYIALERLLARWTSTTVVVAVADQIEAARRHIGGTFVVIPTTVDLARYGRDEAVRARKRAELGLTDADFVVGTVTRLAFPKDTPALAAIAGRLAAFDDLVVVVAGDGPEREVLEAEIARTSRVLALGAVDDVPAVLNALDAFVLATRSEGLPKSIVEAMATGLPVVANAVGGVPELIADGVDGLLVPVGDVDCAVRMLVAVRSDDALRRRLGEAAIAKAREHGDDVAVDALVEVYDRLVRATGVGVHE
jgi:glycosyltransferase involved in cell wall biosynthesis